MNDAEQQFAARLGEDLERVVGPGISIDDLDLHIGDGVAKVSATLRVGTRSETIEALGRDALSLYEPLLRQAAETRLAEGFRQLVESPLGMGR
jgi:hypothetical protein